VKRSWKIFEGGRRNGKKAGGLRKVKKMDKGENLKKKKEGGQVRNQQKEEGKKQTKGTKGLTGEGIFRVQCGYEGKKIEEDKTSQGVGASTDPKRTQKIMDTPHQKAGKGFLTERKEL